MIRSEPHQNSRTQRFVIFKHQHYPKKRATKERWVTNENELVASKLSSKLTRGEKEKTQNVAKNKIGYQKQAR